MTWRLFCLLATLHAVLARVCKTDAARRLPWAPYWLFDLRGCTRLYLANAGLGRGGAEALATSLRTNHELKELNIFNNSIGDAGAHRLAEALEHDMVLASLFLERNGISNEGLVDLANHLEVNTAVTTLGLFGNELGATSRAAIARARFVGLEWADGEYTRTAVKSPADAGPTALSAPALSFIPTPASPPPVSAECSVVCGHATCGQMASIGLICQDTRLVCGDACSGCCHLLPPPAPPPPLAPCMDLVEGCLLDDSAICTGAPSLAKSVCMATCNVCETSDTGSSPGLGWLSRAAEAEALPSARRGLLTPLSLLGATVVGVALALAVAMAVSRRRGSGPVELN